MKKTLSSIKVEEATIKNMKLAIKRYSDNNLFEVSEAEFRRIAIELFSQLILQNKEIPIKLVTNRS